MADKPQPESAAIPLPPPGSVCAIVACDENRLIGKGGRLPWRIREDWRWFLDRTRGGACVIGRTSYEAMQKGGNVNEQRCFYVVSGNAALAGPHTKVFPTSAEAVAAARASSLPVWICGGTRIYEECFPACDMLYLTLVHAKLEGDAWLPDWTPHFGEVLYRSEGSDKCYTYTFLVLGRRL
jgi:dihydrofolate reductase